MNPRFEALACRITRTLPRSGFTLVEVLVAIAILALLVALLSQILGAGIASVVSGRGRLDADAAARAVLDRIGRDLDQMVVREDADVYLDKQPGNDRLYFFAEAPGFSGATNAPSGANPVSLVGYRVNAEYQLERLGKALSWDGDAASPDPSMRFLTFPPALPAAPLDASTISAAASPYASILSTDANYDVLGEEVFRFEISYLLTDGTNSASPVLGAAADPGYGPRDIAGIVVSLAVLDLRSQKLAAGGDLTNAISALDDSNPAAPASLPAEQWRQEVHTTTFASSAGLPQKAAGQVRVYQRLFYLNRP
jgi:prepilin-type N-terminal cleavage/methylation domain-containing protein